MEVRAPRVELCGYALAAVGGIFVLYNTYTHDYEAREIALAVATMGIAAIQPTNTTRHTVATIGAVLTTLSAATKTGLTLSMSSITLLATNILKEAS